MPAWCYVIIGIALFVIFLALLKAKLIISYDEDNKLKIFVQILFIKFPLKLGKKSNISVKALFKTLEKLLRSIKIEIEQLTLVVACEDASQTALIYAATTQTLNCSLEYLDSVSTVEVAKDAQITINPDFVSRKTQFSGRVNIYIGVLFFLYWYLILLNLKYD